MKSSFLATLLILAITVSSVTAWCNAEAHGPVYNQPGEVQVFNPDETTSIDTTDRRTRSGATGSILDDTRTTDVSRTGSTGSIIGDARVRRERDRNTNITYSNSQSSTTTTTDTSDVSMTGRIIGDTTNTDVSSTGSTGSIIGDGRIRRARDRNTNITFTEINSATFDTAGRTNVDSTTGTSTTTNNTTSTTTGTTGSRRRRRIRSDRPGILNRTVTPATKSVEFDKNGSNNDGPALAKVLKSLETSEF